jgi:hypothetical protein
MLSFSYAPHESPNRNLSCYQQTKTNVLVASSKVLPDPSGGALRRRWQFKRLSTSPDMRAAGLG